MKPRNAWAFFWSATWAAALAYCGICCAADPPAPKPVTAAVFSGQLRHRIAADRFLRRLESEGKLTADQAAAVHLVRSNPDALSDFVAGVPAVKGCAGAFAGDGKLLDWLSSVGKWLWDHREELVAFLMELAKLFG